MLKVFQSTMDMWFGPIENAHPENTTNKATPRHGKVTIWVLWQPKLSSARAQGAGNRAKGKFEMGTMTIE